MSGLLELICADKRVEVVRRMAIRSTRDVMAASRVAPPPRGFEARLREVQASGRTALIGEIKRASPSRGLIRADFDPPALARAYRDGGAACLSVLTQGPHFQGEDSHLRATHEAVDLPILRKDFFVDPYQAIEARALGADSVLLIMAALSDRQAGEIEAAARERGMDVLVEVHNEEELGTGRRPRESSDRDQQSQSRDPRGGPVDDRAAGGARAGGCAYRERGAASRMRPTLPGCALPASPAFSSAMR